MATDVLFVGGPLDGEIRTVDELRPYYKADAREPIDELSRTFRIVEYTLMPFAGEKQELFLYVLAGMRGDVVIAALIEGYAASRKRGA